MQNTQSLASEIDACENIVEVVDLIDTPPKNITAEQVAGMYSYLVVKEKYDGAAPIRQMKAVLTDLITEQFVIFDKKAALQYAIEEKSRGLSRAYPLRDYIEEHFDNSQKFFADMMGVQPAQVTQWIKSGCIVVDGVLYGKRREV